MAYGGKSVTALKSVHGQHAALNAICPYYTMFPISFPMEQLKGANAGEAVLDPFCGRGTTLYAARILGLDAVGIDSNPVAAAISRAKFSSASCAEVISLAQKLLSESEADPLPTAEFWQWAFSQSTLEALCRLRAGLREENGAVADALRALVLGALHGPLSKHKASYFSNQMPRTFSSKPGYSVRYWSARNMKAPDVDVLAVIIDRASRFFSDPVPPSVGRVILGDSRSVELEGVFQHVVTSPPYFGMRSYVPDQWLRVWFLGGPEVPTYVQESQLGYDGNSDPFSFAKELGKVWRNAARKCTDDARMVIRFGSIRSRPSDPVEIIRASVEDTVCGWTIDQINLAGDAHDGKRQADQMGSRGRGAGAVVEYDVVCKRATLTAALPEENHG